MVRCRARKSEKSCLASDECIWKDGKCEYKDAQNSPARSKSPPKRTKSPVRSKSPPKRSKSPASSEKSTSTSTSTSNSTGTPKKLTNLKNRHCMYYTNKYDLTHQTKVKLSSVLKETYDSKYKSLTNIHLGQRKLLLSEIQLLTEYYSNHKKDPILLYIGAAIGSHLLILHELFPNVHFILYDGAAFDKRLDKYPEVFEIHTGKDGFFTTELCKTLKDKYKPLIFVSDIRLGEEDFEKGVMRDMISQKEWIQILKPELSLVKFRMPYSLKHGETLEYLKGDILYGVWPKETSGETRLLIRKENVKKLKQYDFKSYEEVMFFHNKYTRPFCFDIIEQYEKYTDTYCPCYDCISELVALDNYSKVHKALSMDNAVAIMKKLPAKNFYSKPKQPLKSLDSLLETKFK